MIPEDLQRLLPARAVLSCLGIATGGGFLFSALGLPLPWMLGALCAVMVAALARLPIAPAARIRPHTVAVIGVLLGGGFSPQVLEQAAGWTLSLAALAGFLVLAGGSVMLFLMRVGGYGRETAFLCAMPGGLTEMVELGADRGADARAIVLAHVLRIVIVIALIALWFRVIEGHEVSGVPVAPDGQLAGPRDLALMALCGIAGLWLGPRLRLPAAALTGPLILSAGLHLAGLVHGVPPAWLVIAAQIVLGSVLGCRFIGATLPEMRRSGLLGIGATFIALAIGLGFAILLEAALGLSRDQVILAYAPGGLTEMSLVAVAIGADLAFVTLHHVARLLMILGIAPLAFGLFPQSAARLSAQEGGEHDDS
ncbi:AbrB family transcriptional regulator [Halovulum dunhuangense]|uniref:AbrB family transcriptional regulator n=1 Tax=Halovulum dunhuangense TaxID=1505036 RepID=A0A849L244_9RHOB|nr:AbrB family transcriptional regulator [Halovulum dunhuangense]NNU80345.1 AbrB family transcriptional regulator [Halovulum dunhuangense]